MRFRWALGQASPPRPSTPSLPSCPWLSHRVPKEAEHQRHLLAVSHQLVPNTHVHLQTSEWEDFVQRSAGLWEGPVPPATQLLALLCFLLNFLHFSSFSKENLLSLFSIVNTTVHFLEIVMRSSTCSKIQDLTFYFEFE